MGLGTSIAISSHAVLRLLQRWQGEKPRNPRQMLQRMYERSVPDTKMPEHGKVHRLLSNLDRGPAEYRYDPSTRMRLVIVAGTIVTVERDWF